MSYSTPAAFIETLSPTLRADLSAESGTTQDTTVIQGWLDSASAEIDALIGQRVVTPVTATIPRVWLASKERIGAAWFGYKYRGISESTAAASAALNDWKAVLEWCGKVADGTYDIPGATLRTDASTDTTTDGWRSNTVVYDGTVRL